MAKRVFRTEIRLTKEEDALLNRNAERAGLSKSVFIRKAITGAEIRELPPVDYFEVLKHLRQINNNMNQLAVRANYLGLIDSGEYRRNVDMLQEAVGKLIIRIFLSVLMI